MNKHTTYPRSRSVWIRSKSGFNSHSDDNMYTGNWNKHKKRPKLPSSVRTLGRQARFFSRHPEIATPEQYDWAAKVRGNSEPWAFWDDALMELMGARS